VFLVAGVRQIDLIGAHDVKLAGAQEPGRRRVDVGVQMPLDRGQRGRSAALWRFCFWCEC
jgi:hypothetical protein